MAFIYKILGAEEWRRAEAAGVFVGSEVDRRDGYIHFSAAEPGRGDRGQMVCRARRSRAGGGRRRRLE